MFLALPETLVCQNATTPTLTQQKSWVRHSNHQKTMQENGLFSLLGPKKWTFYQKMNNKGQNKLGLSWAKLSLSWD